MEADIHWMDGGGRKRWERERMKGTAGSSRARKATHGGADQPTHTQRVGGMGWGNVRPATARTTRVTRRNAGQHDAHAQMPQLASPSAPPASPPHTTAELRTTMGAVSRPPPPPRLPGHLPTHDGASRQRPPSTAHIAHNQAWRSAQASDAQTPPRFPTPWRRPWNPHPPPAAQAHLPHDRKQQQKLLHRPPRDGHPQLMAEHRNGGDQNLWRTRGQRPVPPAHHP